MGEIPRRGKRPGRGCSHSADDAYTLSGVLYLDVPVGAEWVWTGEEVRHDLAEADVVGVEEGEDVIAPVRHVREGDWGVGGGPGDRISTILVGCGRLTHALGGALEEEGVRTYGFERSFHALDEVRRFPPTLVVVGSLMADRDPYDFIENLRGVDGDVGILFLADRADRDVALEALLRGADDVLPPPHSVSGILLRAHVVANRQRVSGSSSLDHKRVGGFELDVNGRRVLNDGRPVALTGREFELLDRLIQAGGRVVSRGELMEDIWGGSPSEGVLDATVHRLRKKLEENLSEPRFVTTVRGIGYRLEMGLTAG